MVSESGSNSAIEVSPLTPGWQERVRCAVVGAVAAFVAYFCMCAFRRPFMVLEFQGEMLGSSLVELKTALLISQILGYGCSKFMGISLCSQVERRQMWLLLVTLIAVAETALMLFAVVPTPWKLVALFCNGLPLGMIWGLMVRYLEGRQLSDMMLAILACSFILGSGVVKDAGRWWLHSGLIPALWMPAVTGLCFLPPFIIAVAFLHSLPAPDQADQAQRHKRVPMHAADRWRFLKQFCWTLTPLLVFYFFLTAFRDFRDLYAVEIIGGLGYGHLPAILTQIELPVALIVTCVLGLLTMIRHNLAALWAIYGVMLAGMMLIGISGMLYRFSLINGMSWMICMGLGGYLAYVPYNAVLFERFMASTKATGNAVFGIYLADALGYTGSIGLQLLKDLLFPADSRLEFFEACSWGMALVGGSCLLLSALALKREMRLAASDRG